MTFEEAAEPLTARRRNIVVAVAIVIALTRFLSLSQTLWDWDEALFCMGVRSYDVASHHPHPPGYPLFIAAGKLVRPFAGSDFRALQTVVLIASLALFPALFALLREFRLSFAIAVAAAAIYAFFPNVWFYCGTAFSDIVSIALVFAGGALSLRGCRSRRAYLCGALVLGIAAGVRPQNLMLGAVPALIATWCRMKRKAWRDISAAVAIGFAIVAGSYAGAALASQSWRSYLGITSIQSRYLLQTDSFLNPGRPSLVRLIRPFFIDPICGGTRFDLLFAAVVAIGFVIALRDARYRWIVITFLPFQIFAWLMLDIGAASRYATAYVPLYAVLVAGALMSVRSVGTAAVCATVAYLVVYAWPALAVVRTTDSPPVAAIHALQRLPRSQAIFAHAGMEPFASEGLSARPFVTVDREKDLPPDASDAGAPYVREGASELSPHAVTFARDRRSRLARIARARYFEVSIIPVSDVRVFRSGWYDEENDATGSWRWMGTTATMELRPAAPRARLVLRFAIPSALVAAGPQLTLTLNGRVIDRRRVTKEFTSSAWEVVARPDGPNELVLAIDPVLNPLHAGVSTDPRDLGLRLTGYSWNAVKR